MAQEKRWDPEYATIGGLMMAPPQLASVRDWLEPQDFTRPLCPELYQLIRELAHREISADPVVVFGELQSRGRIRPDGYPSLELVAMVEAVPTVQMVPYYARMIVQAS